MYFQKSREKKTVHNMKPNIMFNTYTDFCSTFTTNPPFNIEFQSRSKMKRVVVTGANKGIGLAMVKRLVRENSDLFVYLGSRDSGRGMAAINEVGSDVGAAAKNRVKLLEIDVTSDAGVQRAVAVVKEDLANSGDTLYGVINNAGGGIGGMSAKQVVDLNVYGLKRVTEAFIPLLQNEGKMISSFSIHNESFS